MAQQRPPSRAIGLERLNHFGVGVSDLDRSIEFYSTLSGEEPVARGTWSSDGLGSVVGLEGATTIDWATIRLGNVNVDLLDVTEPEQDDEEYQLSGFGGLHVCFEVDDLAAVYDRMEDAGVEFRGPSYEVTEDAAENEEGVGSVVAYFDGPDGEHLELIQPTGPFRREAMLEE